jgi:cell division protein FtsQ
MLVAVTRSSASIMDRIERLAEVAGFGLMQVAVSGQRYTSDSDIYDALDFARARTLLSFDSGAAQKRIEGLPWVAHASIDRVFPDRLDVRITERAPFAAWHIDGSELLIDSMGRVLGPMPANLTQPLPRIAGAGASTQAAALFAMLREFPVLAQQLAVAERVGRRRWTLRLATGLVIALPAEGEPAALRRAAALMEAGFGAGEEIDLRVPDRVLLREVSAPVPAATAAVPAVPARLAASEVAACSGSACHGQ